MPPLERIKLAAWDPINPRKTVLDVGSAKIGAAFAILAGLVYEGDRSLIVTAVRAAKEAGTKAFRWAEIGAAADDGRNADGRFALIREIARLAGLPVIVEVTDTREVRSASDAADILMVGAANMQNYSLLKELGRAAKKPVLLVRGWHSTLREWLSSAEYVLLGGNPQVILCEAGIRSFEAGPRLILDLSAVPAVKRISHLPVIVDVGQEDEGEAVEKMCLAAVAAGADGIIVEISPARDASRPSRTAKGLNLEEFAELAPKILAMSALMEGIGIDKS